MIPLATITAFDRFLAAEGLSFEAVIVGGAALALLGLTTRQTRDCDVLEPLLSAEIEDAARRFAGEQRAQGVDLADDWLNNGPRDLIDVLPEGWDARLVDLRVGDALVLRTLGRKDLLCTKLFALCDRGLDLADCLALAPTAPEIEGIEPWVAQRDAHPGWPAHVHATLQDLARRLGHAL
ncbi:MAG: hypothetical protein GY711_23445 [bacterium]|nr:hypothetical protein [bacterium]